MWFLTRKHIATVLMGLGRDACCKMCGRGRRFLLKVYYRLTLTVWGSYSGIIGNFTSWHPCRLCSLFVGHLVQKFMSIILPGFTMIFSLLDASLTRIEVDISHAFRVLLLFFIFVVRFPLVLLNFYLKTEDARIISCLSNSGCWRHIVAE